MPKIINHKILDYDLELLYNIITKVEDYPKFIPWFKSIEVMSKEANSLISKVTVQFFVIKCHYKSQAFFEEPREGTAKVSIEMLEGPFHHFSNQWELKALSSNKTEVTFLCDFSFKNKIYNSIAEKALSAANKKIIQAFIKRAAETKR